MHSEYFFVDILIFSNVLKFFYITYVYSFFQVLFIKVFFFFSTDVAVELLVSLHDIKFKTQDFLFGNIEL